jgi:hypothetical protein
VFNAIATKYFKAEGLTLELTSLNERNAFRRICALDWSYFVNRQDIAKTLPSRQTMPSGILFHTPRQ